MRCLFKANTSGTPTMLQKNFLLSSLGLILDAISRNTVSLLLSFFLWEMLFLSLSFWAPSLLFLPPCTRLMIPKPIKIHVYSGAVLPHQVLRLRICIDPKPPCFQDERISCLCMISGFLSTIAIVCVLLLS